MPVYVFNALQENGAPLTGETAADSKAVLGEELARRGLVVQSIRRKWGLSRAERVTAQQFALFNQELAALVRAGLTVPDALALASDRPDCPPLARVLSQVLADVRNGVVLSEACARHPEVFDGLYLAALRTAEKTGDLARVLSDQRAYLRHRLALRKKVSQALTYPLFLLGALVLILVVLFVFVLPRFVAMYSGLGAELPLPTRVLMHIVSHFYIVAPALVAAGFGIRLALQRGTATESGRRRLHSFVLGLPLIGELARLTSTAQLARSLATLLHGGTPLIEALNTSAGVVSNQIHLDRLRATAAGVRQGESLARAARATQLLPDMATRMVEVGEASGNLDGMLHEVATFYEEALDEKLTRVMTLIEPALMLLMGALVGGIIIIMYLPVFHVADIIK
jgi:type IV pilus assembly protein PilC